MRVKWASLVADAQGSIGTNQYARHIPGNKTYAAVCMKPELSKKTKRKKAALPSVNNFKNIIAICKDILHTPERRAIWQARYDEVKRQAMKRNQPFPGRLCDYVRHEVSIALKNGDPIP